jgi:hypothetical protein
VRISRCEAVQCSESEAGAVVLNPRPEVPCSKAEPKQSVQSPYNPSLERTHVSAASRAYAVRSTLR